LSYSYRLRRPGVKDLAAEDPAMKDPVD
jgi:hypothetical protein